MEVGDESSSLPINFDCRFLIMGHGFSCWPIFAQLRSIRSTAIGLSSVMNINVDFVENGLPVDY
jgi:hypothetical protein